jgi:hypothetical protein
VRSAVHRPSSLEEEDRRCLMDVCKKKIIQYVEEISPSVKEVGEYVNYDFLEI